MQEVSKAKKRRKRISYGTEMILKMGFDFTYMFSNNLEKMEHFYSNVLNLDLIHKDDTAVAYKIDNHQLLITLDENVVASAPKFSKQPGWEGGTASQISWSLEVDPKDFIEIVKNVKSDSTVIAWNDEPKWIGYWSFPVLDPMNQTIEITCTYKQLG
jgi:hypothetical protein